MMIFCGLHGFLGHPIDFDPIKTQFDIKNESKKENKKESKITQYFIPDLLDKSFPFQSHQSLPEWAKLFNSYILDQHGDSKKTLCGYSLGGRLALHALLDNPNLWNKVVFLSTNPGVLTKEEKKLRLIKDEEWAEKFKAQELSVTLKEWDNQPVFEYDDKIKFRDQDRMYLYQSEASNFLQNWSLAKHDVTYEMIKKVQHKTHWVVGEKDKKFKNILSKLIEKTKLSSTQKVSGAGHRILPKFQMGIS
jgi:2-succinyl-6-hydroxy-2,4-cyclohexadiene-1-carboxylate synthase